MDEDLDEDMFEVVEDEEEEQTTESKPKPEIPKAVKKDERSNGGVVKKPLIADPGKPNQSFKHIEEFDDEEFEIIDDDDDVIVEDAKSHEQLGRIHEADRRGNGHRARTRDSSRSTRHGYERGLPHKHTPSRDKDLNSKPRNDSSKHSSKKRRSRSPLKKEDKVGPAKHTPSQAKETPKRKSRSKSLIKSVEKSVVDKDSRKTDEKGLPPLGNIIGNMKESLTSTPQKVDEGLLGVDRKKCVTSPFDPLTPMDAGVSRSQLVTVSPEVIPPAHLSRIQPAEESPVKESPKPKPSKPTSAEPEEESIVADLKKAISGKRGVSCVSDISVVKEAVPVVVKEPSNIIECSHPALSSDLSKLIPIRKEPVPMVRDYVASLQNLEYDFKKYTCFFCLPCRAFETTTPQWEIHLSGESHRKSLWLWRQCKKLSNAVDKEKQSINQKAINLSSTFCTGAEHIVEMNHKDKAMCYVCVLCQVVKKSVEDILKHLATFEHLDNYLEAVDPSSYRPPFQESSDGKTHFRKVTPEIEKKIVDACKSFAMKNGRGTVKVYSGTDFVDWNPGEQSETEEIEERSVMEKMALLFNEDLKHQYPLRYKMIPVSRSVANQEYSTMTRDLKNNPIIGLQYLVELWTPCRRVMPVYFCTVCDYLVANWKLHCRILKHCVLYLVKHYKPIYECALLESSNEEEFRWALTEARSKILGLEGHKARIEHVVQVLPHANSVFTAINAKIAKRIVSREKMKISDPPRARKISAVTSKVTPKASASTSSRAKSVKDRTPRATPKAISSKPQPSLNRVASSSRLRPTFSHSRGKVILRKQPTKTQLNGQRGKRVFQAAKTNVTSSRERGATKSSASRVSMNSGRPATKRPAQPNVTDKAYTRYPTRERPINTPINRPKIYYGTSKGPLIRMEAAKKARLETMMKAGRPGNVMSKEGRPRLSVAELKGLDRMLKTVNVDLGRPLSQSDVDMLRSQFGNDMIEQLLTEVAKQTSQASEEEIYAVQLNELRSNQQRGSDNIIDSMYNSINDPNGLSLPGVSISTPLPSHISLSNHSNILLPQPAVSGTLPSMLYSNAPHQLPMLNFNPFLQQNMPSTSDRIINSSTLAKRGGWGQL